MANGKRKMGMFLAALFTAFTCMSYMPANAATKTTKKVATAATINYNAAVKAVVDYEKAVKNYKLTSKTNLDFCAGKYKVAMAALGKLNTKAASTKALVNRVLAAKKVWTVAYNAYVQAEKDKGVVDAATALVKAMEAVDAYEKAPITTLEEVAKAEALKQPAVDAIAKVTDEAKAKDLTARVEKRAAALTAKKAELEKFVVSSVVAENLKEVKVTFTKDVLMVDSSDTTKYPYSALNPANYAVVGTGLSNTGVTKVTQIDAKTVLVTLDGKAQAGASIGVTVKSNIKNAAADAKVATYTVSFIAADKVAPSATATVDVTKKVTINFSEPMETFGNVYINNVDVTGQVKFVDNSNNKKAYIVLSSAYEAGKSYEVKLVGAKDAAGNFMTTNPYGLAITIGTDTVKPEVVEAKVSNGVKVAFTFTEALQDLDANDVTKYASITVKDSLGNLIAGTPTSLDSVVADTDNKVYSLDLSTALAGYNYRYVTVTVAGYKDIVGNDGASKSFTVLLTKDITGPALKEAKVNDAKTDLYVMLDEVVAVTADASVTISYTNNDGIVYATETKAITLGDLIDKDGKATGDKVGIKVRPASWLNDDTAKTLKEGTYTLTIAADSLADANGNKNLKMTTTVVVGKGSSTADTTAPVITVNGFVSTNIIQITSDEEIASVSAANFTLDGAALPANTKVYFYQNKKTIRIELPSDSITLTGNRVLGYSLNDTASNNTADTYELTFVENVRPVVASAKQADPDTILLTLTEGVQPLKDAQGNYLNFGDDFEVYVNGKLVEVDLVTIDGDKILINIAAPVKMTDEVTVKIVGSDIVDLSTNKNPLVNSTYTVAK